MEGYAYQEERSNHKREKLSVILFSNTVVKPLQIKMEMALEELQRHNIIIFTKLRSCIPGSDDQTGQHICHKLCSVCCT